MPTKLLLFTSAFPYGKRETFLIPELPFLCREFDQVVIQPIRGASDASRALPPNVDVAAPLWTSRKDKYRLFLKAIFYLRTWLLFIEESLHAFKSKSRYHPASFINILHWSLYRTSLERCGPVRDALKAPHGVVSYSYWGHIPALATPSLADAGIPCVVRYHRADLYLDAMDAYGAYFENIKYFPWRDEIAQKSARSAFISEHGLEYFRANWGRTVHLSDRLVLRRLGVEDRGFKPMSVEGPQSPFVVVSCSTISATKRVHLIARLVKELARSRHVRWFHFGPGECNMLEREIGTDVPDSLEIHLQGWVENDELRQFYLRNDVNIFVNLSLSEGAPVSIMEAISCGIPALATDVGGTSEVVVSGESGLLISADEAKHSEKLAEAVIEALQFGGAIQRSRPRSVWKDRFDAGANFSEFAQELKQLLDG